MHATVPSSAVLLQLISLSLSPPANFFAFILSTILTFWRHSYITPVSIKIYNYSWCHPIFISVDSTTHSPLPATHSLLSKLGPSYRSQAQCLLTAQLIPCPGQSPFVPTCLPLQVFNSAAQIRLLWPGLSQLTCRANDRPAIATIVFQKCRWAFKHPAQNSFDCWKW